MLYHRDNRNEHKVQRNVIILIVLVAIGILSLVVSPIRNVLTQGVYLIAPQMWAASSMVSARWNAISVNFKDKSTLQNENSALRDEVSRMQAQILDRNLLAEQVSSLEASLGRAHGDDRVVARVVALHGQSVYDVLVIDAGTNSGITVGDMVVFAGSGVVGDIIETTNAVSKVKLYSTGGVETKAVVGTRSVPILALGRGMGNFEAKVPENSQVVVGDNVISARGNLILGTVSSIAGNPAEPFKRIYFRVPFNIFEMRSVEVVLSKNL